MNFSKAILFLMLIFLVSVSVTAQETTPIPKKGTIRPDIPGTFSIEIGINQSFNKPDTAVFGLGLWGSRAFNLYYQLDIQLFSNLDQDATALL